MKKILLFLFLAINLFAGVINFAPGKHIISETINITQNNTVVDGGGCILQLAKGKNIPVINVVGVSNIHIKNLIIDGGKDYQTAPVDGVRIMSSNDVFLDNLISSNNSRDGIHINNSKGVLIDGVNVHGNANNGLSAIASSHIYAQNSVFQLNVVSGIDLSAQSNLNKFRNIIFVQNYSASVRLVNSNANMFVDVAAPNGKIELDIEDTLNKKGACFNNSFLFIIPPYNIYCNDACLENVFLLKAKK